MRRGIGGHPGDFGAVRRRQRALVAVGVVSETARHAVGKSDGVNLAGGGDQDRLGGALAFGHPCRFANRVEIGAGDGLGGATGGGNHEESGADRRMRVQPRQDGGRRPCGRSGRRRHLRGKGDRPAVGRPGQSQRRPSKPQRRCIEGRFIARIQIQHVDSAAAGDPGDARAVGRPARRSVAPGAAGQLAQLFIARRDQPQIGAGGIGGAVVPVFDVDHLLAVGANARAASGKPGYPWLPWSPRPVYPGSRGRGTSR